MFTSTQFAESLLQELERRFPLDKAIFYFEGFYRPLVAFASNREEIAEFVSEMRRLETEFTQKHPEVIPWKTNPTIPKLGEFLAAIDLLLRSSESIPDDAGKITVSQEAYDRLSSLRERLFGKPATAGSPPPAKQQYSQRLRQ